MKRQLAPLLEFCEFINALEYRALKEPANQIMPDLLNAIGYEAWLYEHDEPRAAMTKWGNVTEFSNWLIRKGEPSALNRVNRPSE